MRHELEVHQEEVRAQQAQLLHAQAELEASRDRYAELYDFAPVALVTLERGGLIGEVNLAGARLLGVERDRLRGSRLNSFVMPSDRATFRNHLGRCRGAAGLVRTDLQLLTRQGSAVPVELSSLRSEGAGQVVYRTVLTDLSERKRMEAERLEVALERQHAVAAQETARARSEAKDRFLAMLSHELRGPLAPALLALEEAQADPSLPDRLRSTLAMALRDLEFEARLVDDLLDITRIAQGRLDLRLAVVDVHAVLRERAQAVIPDLTAAGLTMKVALDATEYHVRADAARLRQIFSNLLSNTARFVPHGGRIELRSRSDPDGQLHVTLSDTGIGIEGDSRERIFQAFECGDPAQGRRRGLGLGLAIAKGLTEAQDGWIHAQSEGRGRGATFEVELPTVPRPAVLAATPRPAAATSGRPLRVLVVEDDPDTASMLASVIARGGHEVQVAHSLRAALEAAAAGYDLVVSDLSLPDGSGLDLMRRLRAEQPLKGIALTGYGTEHDLRATEEAGFHCHLTKPVRSHLLLQTIERVARE